MENHLPSNRLTVEERKFKPDGMVFSSITGLGAVFGLHRRKQATLSGMRTGHTKHMTIMTLSARFSLITESEAKVPYLTIVVILPQNQHLIFNNKVTA
ncbi:hypothetical protein JTE90_008512 [Oedothorax gibbosus]|uniref:Uncharacterized protein n=1 Tax=Oedothorax gibbosus TaxID=931172 RepID=A0AAV6UYP9_9ARAC|nr:hypothetical protein JTE90_008512 [Oedothorax gibbosus]